MKKICLILLSVWFVLMCVTGCTDLMTYNLSDIIPELMDMETQYPYVEKIIVTKIETGETVTFAEGTEHDRIRMQFEEIQCVRKKNTAEVTSGYSVNFITTDGNTEVLIPETDYQAKYVTIGDYRYELLVNGIDLTFFASMFEE